MRHSFGTQSASAEVSPLADELVKSQVGKFSFKVQVVSGILNGILPSCD